MVGLSVLWVGVKCDRDVARAREALRPDRVAGMAESQAALVHEGVVYDLVVRHEPYLFRIMRDQDLRPDFDLDVSAECPPRPHIGWTA